MSDWYDNRQLIYETIWDMTVGVILIFILIQIFQF